MEKPHIGIAPLPFLVAKTDCIIMKVKCIAQMAMAMAVTRRNSSKSSAAATAAAAAAAVAAVVAT